MLKRINIIIALIITTMLCSCSFFEKRYHRNDIVVSIGDEFLTKYDLEQIIPNGTNAEDSASIVNAYIQRWATDVLLYEHAKKNIPNQKQVNEMVEEYRHRLIVHFYEQSMMQERIPVPTDAQSAIYYHRHIEDFSLQEPIMKGIVLFLPNEVKKLDQIRKNMHKPLDNLESIEKYALQYAIDYKIFLDDWLYKKTLTEMASPMSSIKTDGYFEASDSIGTAICYITEFISANEPAPEELMLDKARAILYQQKQMEFLQNFGDEIYQYGLKHNEITFHNNEN